MMALTGHVTTAGSVFVVWYAHAVEYSDGELATDREVDGDREAEGEDCALPP